MWRKCAFYAPCSVLCGSTPFFALRVPNVGWAEPGAKAQNVATPARPREKLANNPRRPQMALRLRGNLVCSNVLGPEPHARSRAKQAVQTSNKAIDQEP